MLTSIVNLCKMNNTTTKPKHQSDNTIAQFEQKANQRFHADDLQDGYAPFCKHLFLKNDFTNARLNTLPITPDNEYCLQSKYKSRNDKKYRY